MGFGAGSPDRAANSALMLVAARLQHIAGTRWGSKRFLDMDLLKATLRDAQATIGGRSQESGTPGP
jgi:hypothetical protein